MMRLMIIWLSIASGALNARLDASTEASLLAPQDRMAAPVAKSFETFKALRNEILNLIGSATSRVWVSTQYLTDGEIVASLYVASYRKIDVRVLLGPQKANAYMSRLNFLRKEKVPVYLASPSFRFAQDTGLLIDQDLYALNSDLNFMTAQRNFGLKSARRTEVLAFDQGFKLAFRDGVEAAPREPRDFKPRQAARFEDPPRREMKRARDEDVARPSDGERDGSYDYNTAGKARRKAPEGVPVKLPKTPLYLKERPRLEGVEKLPQEKDNRWDVTDEPRGDAPTSSP